MVKVTKSQLQEMFDGNQTWEQMAENFTAEANVEITAKMVQEMFKANGFNLRTRKQPKPQWFTVIDDVATSVSKNTEITDCEPESSLVETEEFA